MLDINSDSKVLSKQENVVNVKPKEHKWAMLLSFRTLLGES